jgi:hypothetical protein
MTKTNSSVVSNRFANPSFQLMLLLDLNVEGSFVWDFEFWSLEIV